MIADIKDTILLSAAASKYMKLEKVNQSEWRGICPFHTEATPSFTINDAKQFYHCFGCGSHGDVFDLIQHFTGNSINEIKDILRGSTMVYPHVDQEDHMVEQEYLPMLIDYVPPAKTFDHGQHGTPVYIWKYMDIQGQRLCYVCRFKGKEFRTLTLWKGQDDHLEQWKWKSLPPLRPLYGLWKLTERPLSTVVMCEGEKDANAAQKMLPETVCMAWPNGASSTKQCDWSPLAGRNVIMWPDADEPGRLAAQAVREHLSGIASSFEIFVPPSDVPKGWGASDALSEGWPLVITQE